MRFRGAREKRKAFGYPEVVHGDPFHGPGCSAGLERLKGMALYRGKADAGFIHESDIRHNLATPCRAGGHNIVPFNPEIRTFSNQAGTANPGCPSSQFSAEVREREEKIGRLFCANTLGKSRSINVRSGREGFFAFKQEHEVCTVGK
jgi:hypothetical protein